MQKYFDNDMQPSTFTMSNQQRNSQATIQMDQGPYPYIIDINKVAKHNNNYRTTLWTGTHLQLTVMSIDVNEDIGVERHPSIDQCICIVQGSGLVQMGNAKNALPLQQPVFSDSAILIPAGTWHNVINTGKIPLKLFTLYAPVNHPKGTVHETKEIAQNMHD